MLILAAALSAISPMQLVEETKSHFPKTEEAIERLAKQSLSEFEKAIDQIISTPLSEQNYQTVLEKIQKVSRKCLVATSILHEAHQFHTEENIVNRAKKFCYETVTQMTAHIAFNEKLKTMVLNLQKHAEQLTTKQLTHLKQVLHSLGAKFDLPSAPFEVREGKVAARTNCDKLSVLTYNVCGLFDETPLIFGGVLPWKQRIERIVQTIESSEADVVCLQEVFDEELEEALYERLKEKYASFYTMIAPRYLGFKPSTYGVRSGLMVFSKFPVDNARFDTISAENPYVNRGLFSFDVAGKVRIATTHLAAFRTPKLIKKRLEQITTVTELLQSMGEKKPVLLCGDLNIAMTSGEPAEQFINEKYKTNYYAETVTQENCTYCDFTNFHWKENFRPKYTILDYILHLKKTPAVDITTKRINTWGQLPPFDAASDHMGLLAHVSFRH